MPGVHTFYDGSTFLEPVTAYVGVDTDRLNFVSCMFLSLLLAFLYRKFFQADVVPRQLRIVVPPVIGTAFLFFCFGRAIKHLLANCLVSYVIMFFAPGESVHKLVFLFSMSYLLFIHFYRWVILDSYTLDITGPIMVAVEKVTMMACNLHDGKTKNKGKLTEEQKKEAINDIPSLLEYMSFIFNFQTVLTGPANNYSDYLKFLEGNHVQKNANGKFPSPTKPALRKVCEALFYASIVVIFADKYRVYDVSTEPYLALPYVQWFFWWFITLVIVRCSYYFAWVFADAICNMSGFGFSGYDLNGNAKWELCTNVRPLQVEMAQSFKETLDGWNILTGVWLRKVGYERFPKKIRTMMTYVLSAVWHGVSIGYYISFFTAGLFTLSAATFRRCMRWRFLNDKTHKLSYDLFSFAITKIALAYATYSFVIMNLHPSVDVLARVYFLPHFIAAAVLVGLPKIFPPLKKPKEPVVNKLAEEKKEL